MATRGPVPDGRPTVSDVTGAKAPAVQADPDNIVLRHMPSGSCPPAAADGGRS